MGTVRSAEQEMLEERSLRSPVHADSWWPLLAHHLSVAGREAEASQPPIQRLLSYLPHDCLIAFEYPLRGEDRPSLPDISIKIEEPGQAESLAVYPTQQDAPWKNLLVDWANARRRASDARVGAVDSLWLEFDLRRTDELPEPLVILTLPDNPGSPADWLELLPGGPRPAAQRRTLKRCGEALVSGSKPMYLFDLSARNPGALRLELYGVPIPEIGGYLQKIAAPIPRWLSSLETLIGDGQRLHLSFDILPSGEIGERIGVETSFRRLPHREPRWMQLLSRLVEAELCDLDVPARLLRWLGQDRASTAGTLWPNHPSVAAGNVARVLSHIKVVGMADGDLTAKTYFLFRYLRFRPTAKG